MFSYGQFIAGMKPAFKIRVNQIDREAPDALRPPGWAAEVMTGTGGGASWNRTSDLILIRDAL